MLTSLTTHFDRAPGEALPLPDPLAHFYERLAFTPSTIRPAVITNFVSTLDGIITLDVPGHSGGGDISGFNLTDRAVMGLLRAAASAVIVGSTQLRKPPGVLWTPQAIYPPFAEHYAQLRSALGLPPNPLQVVVSASGRLDTRLPLFNDPALPVLILTTPAGAQRLAGAQISSAVQVHPVADTSPFSARQILDAVVEFTPQRLLLIEGGPFLAGSFLAEHLLDTLFLTLAPQVAGRAESTPGRVGFVFGQIFAPHDPRWGQITSLKQAGDHLFLRYDFSSSPPSEG